MVHPSWSVVHLASSGMSLYSWMAPDYPGVTRDTLRFVTDLLRFIPDTPRCFPDAPRSHYGSASSSRILPDCAGWPRILGFISNIRSADPIAPRMIPDHPGPSRFTLDDPGWLRMYYDSSRKRHGSPPGLPWITPDDIRGESGNIGGASIAQCDGPKEHTILFVQIRNIAC